MGLKGLTGEGFVPVLSPALPDLEGGVGGLWDRALLDPEVSRGLEVPLGGKGASTTSDRPGPPVSPPVPWRLGLLDPEVINVVIL